MSSPISFSEARKRVIANILPQPTETIPLEKSHGRTLAIEVLVQNDLPLFDNSGVDGFALRLDGLVAGSPLKVFGTIPAGEVWVGDWPRGTCLRIMTGAPIPNEAEAVAMVEWTTPLAAGFIRLNQLPQRGEHIRKKGSDLKKGSKIAESGQKISPALMGALASLGLGKVEVFQQPRVAILTTGNEVVDLHTPLTPGKIRNTSRYLLEGIVSEAGGTVVWCQHAKDDVQELQQKLPAALADSDILVVCGGVSVGDYDFVKPVLQSLGWKPLVAGVRQRPGKPFSFGRLDDKLVFGLPGNPVSTAVCFDQYVYPAMRAMMQQKPIFRNIEWAKLSTGLSKVAHLHHFVRGILLCDEMGQNHVTPTGPQGSHVFASMVQATCLIHLPEGPDYLEAGTIVAVERLT